MALVDAELQFLPLLDSMDATSPSIAEPDWTSASPGFVTASALSSTTGTPPSPPSSLSVLRSSLRATSWSPERTTTIPKGVKDKRKRARRAQGDRHRRRPRACELAEDDLKHQRKLAREAATRRRGRWLEEQAALAGAMAASVQRTEELETDRRQLQQELTILRDVIGHRHRQTLLRPDAAGRC